MRNSLIIKLMGAFLLLIIVSALIISIPTMLTTKSAFDQYSNTNRQNWSTRLAGTLVDYYETNGSWDGIDTLLASTLSTRPNSKPGMFGKENDGMRHSMSMGMMGNDDQHVILADQNAVILFDSSGEHTGKYLPEEDRKKGITLLSGSNPIGTLIVSKDTIGKGTPAAAFLTSVNRSIVASVIVSLMIAIILGGVLFNQVTSPLRQLKKAADAVGTGNFKERVSIHSNDEFADVGRSFNQMAESLEKAEENRLHYMADIAHELRTPLTAIQGTIEAMQDKILPLDEEQLDNLHSQTILLNRLVNDLRLLSLAETGHLKLDLKYINPGELTRQTLESMKLLAGQKSITIKVDIQDGLPECKLDSDRYAQIINNLLSNAIRYTPEKGTITVKLSSSTGNLELSIIDTGSGIPPEDLPFVFDRFYRADRSRSRASGGAGLGLAIVKHLVEAHGGRISVISPVEDTGYGTRFDIQLPVHN
ncbi:two-component sensor histidine kinase [Leptolinea sp. HRD-7]|nr:two-component sensor histidine kinase [Leptolinea sp. HRD-7]